jgi:hypothetical protein
VSGNLSLAALVIGVGILVLPFDRHQSDRKLGLGAVAPLLQATYGPGQRIPLFHANFHVPEAVIYFHVDREAVQMKSLSEALTYPLVVTGDGGFKQLQKKGYEELHRAKKLVLARRAEPKPVP